MSEVENNKSKRIFKTFFGIFLCLLSLILIINVGYIARTLAFPILYLFGVVNYLIYIFLYIVGMSYIIKGKMFKFKHKLFFIGLLVILIGISFIYTQIVLWDRGATLDFVNEYNKVFFGVEGGYYNSKYLNLFTSPYGGGFIGYLIICPLNVAITRGGTLAISIIVVLLGIFLIMFTWIKKWIKRLKNKKEEDNNNDNENEETVSDLDIKETDIYLNAREIGQDEVIPIVKNNSTNTLNFDNRDEVVGITDNSPFKTANCDENDKKGFQPVKFSPSLDEEVKNDYQENKISNENIEKEIPGDTINEKPSIDKTTFIVEEKEEIKENNEPKPVIIEQTELDFNAKPEFNKELLYKQNEFVEPEVINKQPAIEINNPISSEEDIEEEDIEEEETIKLEPAKDLIKWIPPSVDLLNTYKNDEENEINKAVADERQALINEVFAQFKVNASCVSYTIGPSITRFNIDYESTTMIKSVNNIIQDISRNLNGAPVRFEATVKDTKYSGLEVPNGKSTIVSFKEVYESLPDFNDKPFVIPIGKNISGEIISGDFCDFPHLLVSGTTGSGKSVFLNALITTMCMRLSPDIFRLVLVDPKRVEMNIYKDVPQLLRPVINEAEEAKLLLDKMVEEMNYRYRLFELANYATSLKDYNKYAIEHGYKILPRIVILLDEYADLVDNCKAIEMPTTSLSQKARAAGIHLIIATQRPTVNIITGTIKSNINTRVALSSAASQDSITILDQGGAEQLQGNGDMLFKFPLISRTGPIRLQGCFIKGEEIARVVNYLKTNYVQEFDQRFLDLEEKSSEAAQILIRNGDYASDQEDANEEKYLFVKEWAMCQETVSMSKIQGECGVGFSRARKLFKRLQDEGIVSNQQDGVSKGYFVNKRINKNYDSDTVVASTELMDKPPEGNY